MFSVLFAITFDAICVWYIGCVWVGRFRNQMRNNRVTTQIKNKIINVSYGDFACMWTNDTGDIAWHWRHIEYHASLDHKVDSRINCHDNIKSATENCSCFMCLTLTKFSFEVFYVFCICGTTGNPKSTAFHSPMHPFLCFYLLFRCCGWNELRFRRCR
jgi:hypothetical protein